MFQYANLCDASTFSIPRYCVINTNSAMKIFSVSLYCIVQDNMCVGVKCTVFSSASFTEWVLGKQLIDS
jgi:hypothetical protein